LDIVDWIMELESEFGLTIPNEVAGTFETPRRAADYIARRVDPGVWPPDRIEERVLQLTATAFGVSRSQVRLDSRIVQDLGAG